MWKTKGSPSLLSNAANPTNISKLADYWIWGLLYIYQFNNNYWTCTCIYTIMINMNVHKCTDCISWSKLSFGIRLHIPVFCLCTFLYLHVLMVPPFTCIHFLLMSVLGGTPSFHCYMFPTTGSVKILHRWAYKTLQNAEKCTYRDSE